MEYFLIYEFLLQCNLLKSFNIYFLFFNRYGENRRGHESENELTPIQLISATAYQLKKPNQQMLIPITVWIGMEQAFIGADFTQVS